jgi:hypothetical protein
MLGAFVFFGATGFSAACEEDTMVVLEIATAFEGLETDAFFAKTFLVTGATFFAGKGFFTGTGFLIGFCFGTLVFFTAPFAGDGRFATGFGRGLLFGFGVGFTIGFFKTFFAEIGFFTVLREERGFFETIMKKWVNTVEST